MSGLSSFTLFVERGRIWLPKMFRSPLFWVWIPPFILLAPVYLSGRALFWGTSLLQFIPWWTFAWRTLLAGDLPLWNPYVGMGAPLLANYQTALLYPPTWVYFVLYLLGGVPGMAWGQALLVAWHLGWAGVGMARLAKQLGCSPLAQGIAGLSFGMGNYLVARSIFLSINAAAAWTPWVIAALWGLLEGVRNDERVVRRIIALTACLGMQLLSGHAQTTWYTLLLGAAWALFWSLSVKGRGESGKPAWWALGYAAAAALLAFGLAAGQLLPTAELLTQSSRATAVDYRYALNYSFWPWHLLTFLAPRLFGSPASGDYWGFGNYWEDAVYLGTLPLLLALSTLPRTLRFGDRESAFSRRLVLFLWTVVIVAVMLSLGKFTPFYPWLYHHVPTFAMFQAPARWMLWAVFALALLAGLGAEAWRRPQGRVLYWTRLGTAGAVAVTLGAGLGWMLLREVRPTFVGAMALWGWWCLGSGLLSLSNPHGERRSEVCYSSHSPGVRGSVLHCLWEGAVLLWVAADLLVGGWGLNPAGPLRLYDPSPMAEQVRELAQGGRLHLPPAQENWLKYVRFLRFSSFVIAEDWRNLRAVNLPNSHLIDGLAMTNQFDPLTVGRYAEWMALLGEAPPQVLPSLYGLMDIGAIETLDRSAPYGVRLRAYPRHGRAFWVPCGEWMSGAAQTRARLLSGEVDLQWVVLLEGKAQEKLHTTCSREEIGSLPPQPRRLHVQERGPNRLEIAIKTDRQGWLVIADTWYPGWRATLNGQAMPVWRANYLFRAMFVPAGEHRIVLCYRPLSFWGGMALSFLSLGILAILWRASREAKPKSEHRA